MEKSHYFDAIRLLFIIQAGGKKLADINDYYSVFEGETRLMAFDFWVRYPDYLAHELRELGQRTDRLHYEELAANILKSEEPELRRIPMIRYLFGAYERPDNALAILKSRKLIYISRKLLANKHKETDFYLTHTGNIKCTEIITQAPVLNWYRDRANLVAEIAGNRGGKALKARQYEQLSYATTKRGDFIPPISSKQELTTSSAQ